MIRVVSLACGLVAAGGMLAPLAAQSGPQADICERQARDASGFYGNRIPEFKIGPFTGKISGSIGIGVSRSSGTADTIRVPSGAGVYASEQRTGKREEEYQRVYQRCMATR